ncbi:MAG: hypothetical protein KDC66_07795 [Phaeodactylibacter sp.]|nr:hypothetical protein [Phaeodactylibacter sp.]MCB9274800.1 hypothetical protein [Lewinellaceae bacterium]
MNEKDHTTRLIVGLFLLMAFILVAMRFLPMLRWFFTAGMALAAAGIAVFLATQIFSQSRRKRLMENTTEGRIQLKISHCQEEIEKNKIELARIHASIEELHNQANASGGLSPQRKEEALRLAREFDAEMELRQAKISFFEAAIGKLENMLHNLQLSQTISAKEEELKRLKESRYEDLANLEELRSDVEDEALYLDTIEELSLKLGNSTSLENALHLRRELEEMTRGLQ